LTVPPQSGQADGKAATLDFGLVDFVRHHPASGRRPAFLVRFLGGCLLEKAGPPFVLMVLKIAGRRSESRTRRLP
jgi:hypothetical protein